MEMKVNKNSENFHSTIISIETLSIYREKKYRLLSEINICHKYFCTTVR